MRITFLDTVRYISSQLTSTRYRYGTLRLPGAQCHVPDEPAQCACSPRPAVSSPGLYTPMNNRQVHRTEGDQFESNLSTSEANRPQWKRTKKIGSTDFFTQK